MPDSPENACLAIADISGYTSYLAGVELDHAQDILSDLTVTVVEAMAPFQLLKLEGDAAFMYLPGDRVDGSVLQDTIESTYLAFRRRLRDIDQATSCECDACIRIPDLDLKTVVHHGRIGRQRLMGLEELVGPDVILVHRLLKNRVSTEHGVAAYALYSQEACAAAGIDPLRQGMLEHHEQVDVSGDVVTWVVDLEAVWQRSLTRPRQEIPPERRAATFVLETTAPPHIVWEFVTSPARRVTWDTGVTSMEEQSPDGRRGADTVNHCMHGPNAILEEIIDWRPPEYWLSRTTATAMPGSPQFLRMEQYTRDEHGGTRVELTTGTVEGRSPEDDAEVLGLIHANIRTAMETLPPILEAAAQAMPSKDAAAAVRSARDEAQAPAD